MNLHLKRNPLTALGRRNALLVALGVPLTFGQCQAEQARTSMPPPAQGSSSRQGAEEGDDDLDREIGGSARP